MKSFLPITLNITNKNIVIIGGGKVAYTKVTILLRFTDNIQVYAPDICDEITQSSFNITWIETIYTKDLLKDAFLVYACTNNKDLNLQIKHDGNEMNKLVNIVDNPDFCDFISPAIIKEDYMTIAVGSNGCDVRKSIKWRNKIKDCLSDGRITI